MDMQNFMLISMLIRNRDVSPPYLMQTHGGSSGPTFPTG